MADCVHCNLEVRQAGSYGLIHASTGHKTCRKPEGQQTTTVATLPVSQPVPGVPKLTAPIAANNGTEVVVSGSLLIIRKPNFQQEAMVAVLTHTQAADIVKSLVAAHNLAPPVAGDTVENDALNTPWPECPITRRPFFMNMDHPEMGEVPTFGGPFDSYTIPKVDDDGDLRCERYDHDAGAWVEGGEPAQIYLTTAQPCNHDLPAFLARHAEPEFACEHAAATPPAPPSETDLVVDYERDPKTGEVFTVQVSASPSEAVTREFEAPDEVYYPGIVDQKTLAACLETAEQIIREPKPDRIERFHQTKAKLIAQIKAHPLSFDEWNTRAATLPAADVEISEAQRLYEQTTQGDWTTYVPTLRIETDDASPESYAVDADEMAWIAAAHDLWPKLVAREGLGEAELIERLKRDVV